MGVTATAIRFASPLLHRLAEARIRSDELFSIVHPEALYDRPISQRHRIIFYIGHLETFDWNLLGREFLQIPSFAPAWDQLFSFGIDPMDGGLPSDEVEDWPRHQEVTQYALRLRETLDHHLASFDDFTARRPELAQLLHVAIEHRFMHVETLAYMLHQLPIHRKSRPPGALSSPPPATPFVPRMVEIPAGNATLGLPRSGNGPFGWDNEFEEHTVAVPAFRIGSHPVTNSQFLHFMEEGGYSRHSLWSEDDRQWLASSGTTHPAFWLRRNGQWLARTMFDEVPLPPDWPVSVSHAEASAYARWAGQQLPNEEQWHRAAYGQPDEGVAAAEISGAAIPGGLQRAYPWGSEAPASRRGNFDLARWDPTSVNAFPAGDSAFGVGDLLGNGWEWTRTPFAPFDGFQPFPFYPGYSANFFDGRHYVMKGGSQRTAACMLRRSFRNWFRPHYPFVYAAFRCIEH